MARSTRPSTNYYPSIIAAHQEHMPTASSPATRIMRDSPGPRPYQYAQVQAGEQYAGIIRNHPWVNDTADSPVNRTSHLTKIAPFVVLTVAAVLISVALQNARVPKGIQPSERFRAFTASTPTISTHSHPGLSHPLPHPV